jgi:DNA-binding LacI/PurR family transcriptional regulator
MASQRPTNADVARLVGVSTATVSYVLNEVEGRKISPRTREAVYRAAEQLGYRPNLAARNLARGKSGVVLYVLPRVAVGEMPMQAGSRMTTELARVGLLQVQFFETEDDQHVIDAIKNLDPIAITSLFPLSKEVLAVARAASIPHIEIGPLPALGAPHLSIGELRVEHLVSRGHRCIAFAYAGAGRWHALGDYWLQGVTDAAQARGLPPVHIA